MMWGSREANRHHDPAAATLRNIIHPGGTIRDIPEPRLLHKGGAAQVDDAALCCMVTAGPGYIDFSQFWPISTRGRTSPTSNFTEAWIIAAASSPTTAAICLR